MIKTTLKGLGSQPWIDLEPWLDLESLNRDRVAACLAACQPYRWTSIVGAQGNLWDQSQRELGDYAREQRQDPQSPYRAILDQLSPGPLTNQFFRYVRPELVHLNDCVHLTAPSSYEHKHLADHCPKTAAALHFGFLFEWIDQQRVFEQWGRVVFWLAERGQSSALHRDYPTDDATEPDEFIWLDLTKTKQFFVSDGVTKSPITSRAAWFNNRDWHGSEPATQLTYSLRIDGVFTDRFRKELGN